MTALVVLVAMLAGLAPSIRSKATRWPPSSTTAMFIFHPSLLAFASPPAIALRAPARVSRTCWRRTSGDEPEELPPGVAIVVGKKPPPSGLWVEAGRTAARTFSAARTPLVRPSSIRALAEFLGEGVADLVEPGLAHLLEEGPGRGQDLGLVLLLGDQDENPPVAVLLGPPDRDLVDRLALERFGRLHGHDHAVGPVELRQRGPGLADRVGREHPPRRRSRWKSRPRPAHGPRPRPAQPPPAPASACGPALESSET